MARKNVGMAMPTKANIRVVLSTTCPSRTAAITPSRTPMPTDRKSAGSTISSVAGKRVAISLVTGCPLTSDRPKSPRKALPM